MINVYTWFLGLLIVAMEGVLLSSLGVDNWSFQAAIAMVLLVAFEREFVPGALIVSFWLLPFEWMVAGPPGHYSAGLVVVFFAGRLVGPSIQGGSIARLVAAFAAALIHGLVVAGTFLMFDPSSAIGKAILWQLLPASIITAGTTLGLGIMLGRADDRLFPERKSRGLLSPS